MTFASRTPWWLAGLSLSLAAPLGGCGADLGECDDAAAHTVVYDTMGVPYYAGQAVVHESCAGGAFCHSASAKGKPRYDAPSDLNFDVLVVDGDSDADTQAHVLKQLKAGHATIKDEAEELYGEVEEGAMPPDGHGKRPRLMWLASDGEGGAVKDGENAVPSVRTSEGVDVLRNWLACNAPVVAGTDGADAAAEDVGDVLPKASNLAGPEANWTSIYETVIEQRCVTCHNANIASAYPNADLDLSRGSDDSTSAAYAALFDMPAFSGGPCKDWGTLVVPNDCDNSLLLQKLEWGVSGATPECGDGMPLAQTALDQATRDAICEWIMAGAPEN